MASVGPHPRARGRGACCPRFQQFEKISHGVFEFDLSALPEDATITKAEFVFHIFSTGFQPAVIDVFGMNGDGQVTLGDGNRPHGKAPDDPAIVGGSRQWSGLENGLRTCT